MTLDMMAAMALSFPYGIRRVGKGSRMARTHRSPDKGFASQGAVHQSGGTLPVYICETCGGEVVWVESKRTGRSYLANVAHGYMGQRYYIGASIHDDERIMGLRAEDADRRERDTEAHNDALYLLSLRDDHDDGKHVEPFPRCIFCERGNAPHNIADVIGPLINR